MDPSITHQLQKFQAFLYTHIPLVSHMQLKLDTITPSKLIATAPLLPNINDKSTVFGGSSAALMTICGWSIIKYHLEANLTHNDVVIHQSQINWNKAQSDDLIITAQMNDEIHWSELASSLKTKNRTTKINVLTQVLNQSKEVCSEMNASYIVLKNQ